jgi:bifunctional DNA-binding transcriptional regulator/antitoxin component of YhaV-PrlF toxin-antitoxin module
MGMKITIDGSIRLPAEIRERLGFLPHTEIEYMINGETLLLRKSHAPTKGKKLISRMKGTATAKATTDQIMELTRGE